jgi:hypothetical protein
MDAEALSHLQLLEPLLSRFSGPKRARHQGTSVGLRCRFNAADPDLVSVHWLVNSCVRKNPLKAIALSGEQGYKDLIEIFFNG